MKVVVKDELRTRLTCAAQNGSIVARDILAEIRANKDVSETIRGKANYFATKRKRHNTESGCVKIKVVFTCCNKDISNEHFSDRNNPQAMWYSENRTEIEPSTFVSCFKNLPEYTSEEIEYFINAICVTSKVSVKLYDKMSDFEEAYLAANYTPVVQIGESTLHNSCMRHDYTARNAADFYYNFAGAKIVIAKDSEGHIMGRAIVWPKTIHSKENEAYECSFLDRVYYSHSFIIKMIYDYAEDIGINLRKQCNDYCSMESFVVMNAPDGYPSGQGETIEQAHITVKVPASKWHKKGAPYLDTLAYLSLNPEGTLSLSNRESTAAIAMCRSTEGYATRIRHYCPKCGKLHGNDHILCRTCYNELFQDTFLGSSIIEKLARYKNLTVPSSFLKRGRPNATFRLYLQIQKLYNK